MIPEALQREARRSAMYHYATGLRGRRLREAIRRDLEQNTRFSPWLIWFAVQLAILAFEWLRNEAEPMHPRLNSGSPPGKLTLFEAVAVATDLRTWLIGIAIAALVAIAPHIDALPELIRQTFDLPAWAAAFLAVLPTAFRALVRTLTDTR